MFAGAVLKEVYTTMAKHLNLDDRTTIQIGLKEGKSISEIAKELCKEKTTILREIKSKRHYVDFRDYPSIQARNACIERYTCKIKENCKSPECYKRNKNCRLCGKCISYCDKFTEEKCPKYNESPFVCNGCEKKPRCTLSKWLYDAKKAQSKYENVLSESRQGISLSETELNNVNNIISPLLKKGQSVRSICENNSDKIMLSEKTVYNYIGKRLLSADKFDLARTVQRKIHKKAGPPLRIDKKCRSGRTYADFENYLMKNPDTPVVEIDTVEGRRGGKVILTVFFRNCGIQLGFLRDKNDSASVTGIFQNLMALLDDDFKILFPVVLGDRGSEFSNPGGIEVNFDTGEIVSSVFYCDPQCTNQKSRCEKNHEFIRYILPKKSCFDRFEQKDITLMMNHINSYGRKMFNNKSPLENFIDIYGPEIAKKLDLVLIPATDIVLKPTLLK
jgi:IS30 family transposase